MAKLSVMTGNPDTNFTQLFGNKQAGALFSQAQAAMISYGTEMENFIIGLLPNDRLTTLQNIRGGIKQSNREFIIKPKRPKSGDKAGLVADFGIVDHHRQTASIIELKLGAAFDTQKAPKMRETLQTIADYITSLTGLSTDYYVCAFYADEVDGVYEGLKRAFEKQNILTGRQFCRLMEIDYEVVMDKAVADQPDNLNYFLLRADEIRAETGAEPHRYFADQGGLLMSRPRAVDSRQMNLFGVKR